MPSQLTYPGVYVEEIPSGVRTIGGVATSIAAFIGWLPKGRTNRPEVVLSFADFERKCGGLAHPKSLVAYAVSHFFLNGGQQAYVLRQVAGDAAVASGSVGGLTFTASSAGEWANDYAITIVPAANEGRFRAVVQRARNKGKTLNPPITEEVFEALSVDPADARYAASVIATESALVDVTVPEGTAPPSGGSGDLA